MFRKMISRAEHGPTGLAMSRAISLLIALFRGAAPILAALARLFTAPLCHAAHLSLAGRECSARPPRRRCGRHLSIAIPPSGAYFIFIERGALQRQLDCSRYIADELRLGMGRPRLTRSRGLATRAARALAASSDCRRAPPPPADAAFDAIFAAISSAKRAPKISGRFYEPQAGRCVRRALAALSRDLPPCFPPSARLRHFLEDA